jgi:hypothetical protein
MPSYPTPAAGQAAAADNGQSIGQSKTVDDPPITASTTWDPYGTNFVTPIELTASQTLDFAPMIVLTDASGAAVTVTLPDPGTFEGKTVTIQKMDATGNAVNIATASGTIYGGTTAITTQYTARDYTAVNSDTYLGWVGR